MSPIIEHLLFFSVGFFQDILITYYYQAVAKERAVLSSGLSFVVTLVNLLVLYGIISGIEDQVLSIILVYALGNAVGTYVVIHRHKLLRRFSFQWSNR